MTDPDEPQANRLESMALALIFAAVSVLLLALIGVATRTGQASGGWWTRPAFAPGVALVVLTGANLITLWRDIADLRANPATAAEWEEARAKMLAWLRPLEFLAHYAAYIWAIQHLGYFPSTLIFVLGLLWRVGLTAPRWMLAGFGLSVFMIGVFRAGLGVWMPAPDVYDLFPDAIRLALLRWF
ncbi:tripartite tricarboxylate transporter TctB family protein [Fuscovulum ytuae]|uniref:Tripartite tricarboxylate transporter TctB family protein n=1 Tax=Fuscovulum ytuae TaxID=3042299 RepID=A0ABY8Q8U7_9RHOB|nr:tripartite tricarboxylate transporter TctB family protein [Fuscovulum sp. YMD61]WGV17300.1 tripartite tricarboxylate transporter TctB family protein [Fuscovulum sp. YMD61]